jgi:competence protein ComEA
LFSQHTKCVAHWISEKSAILEDRLAVMIWIKRWVKDFFTLSRSQVNGFIVLIPLLVIILFAEPVWHWYVSLRTEDFSMDRAKLDSLIALWDVKRPESNNGIPSTTNPVKSAFFSFDPNQATAEEFQALGFSSALSGRIVHYREKGGKFRVKSDLLKIYGVDSSFYQQLYTFIDLPEKVEFKKKEYGYKKPSREKYISKFDLNRADTSQLKKIYGIGERLSLRIIKYRDALGGFIVMDQVLEVYGLDSAVVNRLVTACFVENDFQPVKININTADENTLATHPYLKNAAAKSIVAYRFLHGEFKALDDLRKIHALEDNTIQKITPYLTVGD